MSEFFQTEPQLEIRNSETNITVVPTCPYCKREIMAGAAFCPYCSARLDQPIRQNEPNPYLQGGAQQYTQNAGGYASQQYQQQYIPQPQKVDLNKHDQQPYYDEPYPAPDVRTVNEPYNYAGQEGFFAAQSFDNSQVPFAGAAQPNQPASRMRNKWIYFVLTLILGMFGAHNFYENKPIKGALWYLPMIPFSIGVALEMMNIESDAWVPFFVILFLINGVRYLASLIIAILKLINTNGDMYPLK